MYILLVFFILLHSDVCGTFICRLNKNKMKNAKKSKSFLKWIGDAWLKSALILLIVTGGFYAYAQINWPADIPNPVTGVVGMFIGQSSKGFGDSGVGTGYSNINQLCSGSTAPNFDGSHVCSSMEMMNSYNHGNAQAIINSYSTSPTLWINNGPPGYVANSNDCLGWTVTDKGTDPQNPNYGTMWVFASKAGGLAPCSVGRKFACCK